MKKLLPSLCLLFFINTQAQEVKNNLLDPANHKFNPVLFKNSSLSIPLFIFNEKVKTIKIEDIKLSPLINKKAFYHSIVYDGLKSSNHDFMYLTKSTGDLFLDFNNVLARDLLYYFTKEGMQDLFQQELEEIHIYDWKQRPRP